MKYLERLKVSLSNPQVWMGVSAILLVLLPNLSQLKFYLLLDSNFYLAMALAPFIIGIDSRVKGRMLYAWLSLINLVLWHFLGVQTLFFFGLTCALLFFVEQFFGRLNLLTLFFLGLCSPLATYVFKVFGFPIRLTLTQWATSFLDIIGLTASSSGNTIMYLGEEFTVESACSGLKMVIMGLLVCLVIIRKTEKERAIVSGFFKTTGILLVAAFLIIITNLFRIIGLIIMKSPEGSFSHECIGLLSLAVYTIVPLLWLVPRLYKKSSQPERLIPRTKTSILAWATTFVLVAALVFHPQQSVFMQPLTKTLDHDYTLPGYTRSTADFDGYKLEKENALLYVKPCFNFWRADHNPLICWKGSGYTFSRERIEIVEGAQVYMATLSKGDQQIHTAWWYQNENEMTVDQLHWRWKMATGAPAFELYNVSCTDNAELRTEILKLLPKTLTDSDLKHSEKEHPGESNS